MKVTEIKSAIWKGDLGFSELNQLSDFVRNITVHKAKSSFNIGDDVRVNTGVMCGQTGKVESVKVKRAVVSISESSWSFPFSMLEPMEQSVQV